MKILFIGQLSYGQTSRMRKDCLQSLGHEVMSLDSAEFLKSDSHAMRWARRWTGYSSSTNALNKAILASVQKHNPHLVWCEKQEYVTKETLKACTVRGVQTLHYTPDPYFSLWWKQTRVMNESLKEFDWLVTSKAYELEDYRKVAEKTIYVPLGYDEQVHKPHQFSGEIDARFISDVSFVGGWEPRRQTLLSAVASLGVSLAVWGYSWDHVKDGRWTPRRALRLKLLSGRETFHIHKDNNLARAIRGGEVYGDDYARVISGSRISLGFLRTICPDQHTTRSFEIPACGSMMLADRTDEHRQFFEEGKEAEFFSSQGEMLDKIRFYLTHEELRRKIALAGNMKCRQAGYSYANRLKSILERIGI